MKIAVNNGHGLYTAGKRTPPFPGSNKVIKEWEFNHPTALKLADILKADGHEVLLISNTPEDTPLDVRVNKANSWRADLYVSIHYNAYQGVWGDHGGFETLYQTNSVNGKRIAQLVQDELAKVLKWRNRGIKPRSDLFELNRTLMPAVIVEAGFMDNLQEASAMLDPNYQFTIAMAVARAINKYFNYTPRKGTPILSERTATLLQMQQWARNKKATNEFIQLAPIFYKIATEVGINPVVAYAQSAKETGYGKFGGIIDRTYHNPCGLKTKQGGDDNDPNAHARFKTWEEGIQAHIDHLALYAGAPGYPKVNTPDPRHFAFLLGKATTVESLGGQWAPSPTYGIEILSLMKEIENTPIKPVRNRRFVKY
jgi:N-acetylmuramoyl-L-alanine amidase